MRSDWKTKRQVQETQIQVIGLYYQFLLCLFPLLSIVAVSHNFVHGIDQDLNIKMSVNTFCQSHGSGVSNDFLDGGVIAVFVVVMYT